MAAISNARDLILQSTVPRLTVTAVTIVPEGSGFLKDKNVLALSPTTLNLTTILVGFTAAATYNWYYASSLNPNTFTLLVSGTSYTSYSITNTAFLTHVGLGTSVVYKCKVTQPGWADAETTTTINYTKRANDIPVATLNKTSIVLPTSAADVVNYANSDSSITVSIGGVNIPYAASGSNSFSVETAITSGTVTVGAATTSTNIVTNDTRSFSVLSGMAAGNAPATITYTVSARDVDGVATLIPLTQTITKVTSGSSGTNGTRTAVLDMYQWSASAPTLFPSGTSTYTWSTSQFTDPATTNSWTQTPGTGAAGQTLYIVSQAYADSNTTLTSSITWSATSSRVVGVYGSDGLNGSRTAFLEVYQWAATTPTGFPSGTSTYTWSNGSFTAPSTPNGWSLTPGSSTPGYVLYACSVRYSDTATSSPTSVTWNTSTAYAVGSAGTNGAPGATGTAYWLVTSASAIRKSITNVYNPTTLTVSGYAAVGTSSPALYAGRFIIYENGSATASYTSSANESSRTYTPSGTGVTSIKVELYLAGGVTTKLDEQIVPMVIDGATGTNAIAGVLSNDSATVPATSGGTVSSFAGAATILSIYNGSTDDSANWTYNAVKTSVTCTEAITSRTQTVTAMSASVGYVDITASRSGFSSITKRFTVSKAIGGADSTVAGPTGVSLYKAYIASASSTTIPTTPAATTNGATPAGWSPTPVTLTGTQAQFESDGTRAAGATSTTWSPAYLSYFRVGSLSAVSVDTGILSVTGAITVGTAGHIKGGQTAYNTGTGFFLGYDSTAYKFSLGTSTNGITWDGSAFTVNGGTFTAGTIKTASGTGRRAELNASSDNKLKFYDTNNNLWLTLGEGATGTDGCLINAVGTTATNPINFLGGSGTVVKITASALSPTADGLNVSTYTGRGIVVSQTGLAGSTSPMVDIQGARDGPALYVKNTESSTTLYGNAHGARVYSRNGLVSSIISVSYIGGGYNFYAEANNTQTSATDAVSGAHVQASAGYGPFTGAHDGLLAKMHTAVVIGDILQDDEVVNRLGVSDTITTVIPALGTVAGIGILANRVSISNSWVPNGLLKETITNVEGENVRVPIDSFNTFVETHDLVIINSVGEGQINVCGENGNIQKDDLIIVSTTLAGKGMKQLDDIIRSRTIARARESVSFSSATETKQIACIYLCG